MGRKETRIEPRLASDQPGEAMNPTITYIHKAALNWWVYKKWDCGDVHIRGFEMHRSMRDIILAATLYRIERLKALR